MSEQIRIALPSKGRMEEETLTFLEGCGLRVNKTNPRQYTATMPALPGVLVLFQRAKDIPVSVAAGDIDLGITGYDTLVESNQNGAIITIHDGLGYGECSLVVAVPDDWDDVQSITDLRGKNGLRLATKYNNSVKQYLAKQGINGIRIVSADGALESAPTIGYADLIADITSSGTTLRENRLRPLADGVILQSQAILIGNRQALSTRPDLLEVTHQILEFIEAHLRARGQYMIFANMRGSSAEDIAALIFDQTDLGGLEGPTIAPMITREGPGKWWAINLVVASRKLYEAIRQIREIGGSGVVVTPITYIFEELPERYQRLLAALESEKI
jgi:ATP phosphoribosyltransferase